MLCRLHNLNYDQTKTIFILITHTNFNIETEIPMFSRLKVFLAVLIVSVSTITSGEAISKEMKYDNDFRGYFMGGGATLDLGALNSRFGDKGYSEFSENFTSFGGGLFHNVSNKFLFGIEGHLLIGEQESSVIGGKSYSSSIYGGYGFFNTGYLVFTNDRCDIFPILGIGFGGLGVAIGQTSFDNILDNPTGTAHITNGCFLLNLGIGTDYKINVSGSGPEINFLVIGLRGGYTLSPFDSGWYMGDFSLKNDPDGGIKGLYFRITFGGGKIKK